MNKFVFLAFLSIWSFISRDLARPWYLLFSCFFFNLFEKNILIHNTQTNYLWLKSINNLNSWTLVAGCRNIKFEIKSFSTSSKSHKFGFPGSRFFSLNCKFLLTDYIPYFKFRLVFYLYLFLFSCFLVALEMYKCEILHQICVASFFILK